MLEIEAKFTAPDANTLARLAELSELAGYEVSGDEVALMTDAYLDTPDRALEAAGLMLRRRQRGDRAMITVKRRASGSDASDDASSEGAVHHREEYEFDVPSGLAPDAPAHEWPAGKARDLVLAAAGAQPVATLAEGRQRRLLRTVAKDGREVAELSLDTFVIVVRGEELAPQYEVEVELKAADAEADLVAIAGELRRSWGLTPQPLSKSERALAALGDDRHREAASVLSSFVASARPALSDDQKSAHGVQRRAAALVGTVRQAVRRWLTPSSAGRTSGATARMVERLGPHRKKAAADADAPAADMSNEAAAPKRPGILATDSMVEAALKTLRFHFARMLEHEPGTRSGDDPEDLHDMRVATRRMRAALRVFAPYLDQGAVRSIERGLKRTGRTLGSVRDLDVFHEKTQRYLDALLTAPRGDLDPLLHVWRGRYEQARAELLAYLDGPRYARFLADMTALLDDPERAGLAVLTDDGQARPHLVSRVLPAMLYDRVAAVWAYDDIIAGPSTPLVRFHRLRIAGKAMRYTFEFFEEVLGPDAKPLIKATKDMQDHLGDLQDAVVSCAILRNFLTWGDWEPPREHARRAVRLVVAPGVAAYLAARQDELDHLVDEFPKMWTHIGGRAFSSRLARVVGSL